MFSIKNNNLFKVLLVMTFSILISCNNIAMFDEQNDSNFFNISRELVANSSEIICGDLFESRILAGQHIDIGSALIYNTTDGNLVINLQLNDLWRASGSHLDIALLPQDFPMTKTGNPKIGNFEYKNDYYPSVNNISYTFTLDELGLKEGDTVYIAIHLNAQKLVNGEIVQSETAWTEGTSFPGKNWAMFVEYQVQKCEDKPMDAGQLRTQTQGGWGSRANGSNPGAYRDANFNSAFPNGLLIGNLSGNYALFTTSRSIQDFLPQGGTPYYLSLSYENPRSTSAGVLAGQVTALTLSVGFDLADENFGESDYNLKDLKIKDETSVFLNFTVEELLAIANNYLATGSSSYTASDINNALSSINENYVDGTTNNGFLGL